MTDVETAEKNQNIVNTENTDKTENPENANKTENSENTVPEKTEGTVKSENGENNEKSEPTEAISPKAFVGNLPSKTPVEDLTKLFEPYGPVVKCEVVKRWGFVHLTQQVDVERAIKELNKTEFNGSVITVEQCRSNRSAKNKKETTGKKKGANAKKKVTNEKKKETDEKKKEADEKKKVPKKRRGVGIGPKKWSAVRQARLAIRREKRRLKKEEFRKKREEQYVAKRREAFMRRKQNETFGNGPPPMQGFSNNSNIPFNYGCPGPYDNYGGPAINFDNTRYQDNEDMRSFSNNFNNRNMNMGNMGMRDSYNPANDRFQGNFFGGGRTPPFNNSMDNRMFDRDLDNNRGFYGAGSSSNFPVDNRFNQDIRSFRDNRGPEPLMDNQRNMPPFDRNDNSRNRMMDPYDNREYQGRFNSNRNFGPFVDNREPEPLMSRNMNDRFMGGKPMDAPVNNFPSDLNRRDNYGRPLMDDRRPMIDEQQYDRRLGQVNNSAPMTNPSRLMDNSSYGGPMMMNNRSRSMDIRRTPPRNFNDDRSRSPYGDKSPSKPFGQPLRSPPRSPLFDRRNQSTNDIFQRRMPDSMNRMTSGPDNIMNRGPSGYMNRVADSVGPGVGNRFAGGPGNKDWRGPPRRF